MPLKRDGTKISSIAEITADYVNIDLGYDLPTTSLTMDSTLSEIEAALANKDNRPSNTLGDYQANSQVTLKVLLEEVPAWSDKPIKIKFK